ncbi:MAG TPA: queuosine salvage family protein [Solirubrobacteraceae bacterium]|nr:queuosine salvage family protein [Solirubrobacteraceae bacterium]
MDELRQACAEVAARARSVAVVTEAITAYAATLPHLPHPGPDAPPANAAEREARAAYWLTMDAINFGSGWFPTLRKRDGLSGSNTIAAALRDRFEGHGCWTPIELTRLEAATLAPILGQDPDHELMALYATSLRDLGEHVATQDDGSFVAVADAAGGSAVTLACHLGGWRSFADTSQHDDVEVPFLKRAQIAAADLHRAGVAHFADLDDLTMFADNLVPHVLRLDGVLRFEPELVTRIDREELIVHGSPEEVEIRACALHAVELLVAASPPAAKLNAAAIDQLLWHRGQEPRYKAAPRHRSRCTAY